MYKKFILPVMLIFVWLASCTNSAPLPEVESVNITGSGQIIAKEFNLSGFDGIETGLIFDVIVHQGDAYKVEVFADDNFIDHVDIIVQGTTLTMGYKPGYAYDLNNVSVQVKVTMPGIKSLELTSSSHVTLNNFRDLEALDVTLSGASGLDGRLEADKVVVTASSSTYVNLSGSVSELSIFSNGNSLVDFKALVAGQTSLECSGFSQVLVTVLDNLDVKASQNSQVFYYGEPALGEVIVNQFAKVEAMGTYQ